MFKDFSTQKVFDRIKLSWELIQKDTLNYGLMIFVGTLIQGITAGILAGPITLGMYKGARKLQASEKVQINDAFSGMSKFGAAFLLFLLVGLIVGVIALVIGGVFGLLGFLAASAGNSAAALATLITIITFFLSLIVWAATVVMAFFVAPIMGFAILFVGYENLGPVDALKKGLAWFRSNHTLALEFAFGLFLCSLLGAIPVIGGIAAIAFGSLHSLQVYDTEKAAGRI